MKLFKANITENDNMMTSMAKGMVEGTLNSAVVCLGIAGVLYAFGKAQQEQTKKEEEKTEEV